MSHNQSPEMIHTAGSSCDTTSKHTTHSSILENSGVGEDEASNGEKEKNTAKAEIHVVPRLVEESAIARVVDPESREEGEKRDEEEGMREEEENGLTEQSCKDSEGGEKCSDGGRSVPFSSTGQWACPPFTYRQDADGVCFVLHTAGAKEATLVSFFDRNLVSRIGEGIVCLYY